MRISPSVSFRVKLTLHRIACFGFAMAFGILKAVASSRGQQLAPMYVDWVFFGLVSTV